MAKKDWHYLYNTAAWKHIRIARLVEEPTCRLCRQVNKITAASVVDHVIPHKGDEQLFFDISNHQSLCKPCHDSVKRLLETRGFVKGCDANGQPLDQAHHWKQQGAGRTLQ